MQSRLMPALMLTQFVGHKVLYCCLAYLKVLGRIADLFLTS